MPCRAYAPSPWSPSCRAQSGARAGSAGGPSMNDYPNRYVFRKPALALIASSHFFIGVAAKLRRPAEESKEDALYTSDYSPRQPNISSDAVRLVRPVSQEVARLMPWPLKESIQSRLEMRSLKHSRQMMSFEDMVRSFSASIWSCTTHQASEYGCSVSSTVWRSVLRTARWSANSVWPGSFCRPQVRMVS